MMEIMINRRESYRIDMPEKIGADEFAGMMNRLHVIEKMISRDILPNVSNSLGINSDKPTRKYVKSGAYVGVSNGSVGKKRTVWDNRDKSVKLMILYYHGSKEDKKEFERGTGKDMENIGKYVSKLRVRYDIKADEVGLKFYGRGLQTRVSDFKYTKTPISFFMSNGE